jgi:hypothetical protein
MLEPINPVPPVTNAFKKSLLYRSHIFPTLAQVIIRKRSLPILREVILLRQDSLILETLLGVALLISSDCFFPSAWGL